MAAEQFINNLSGVTTLVTALTDTTGTTVVAATAAALPLVPQFRIRIDTEIMLCTALSGTTLTVVRGVEGTTAATHLAGTSLACILTATSVPAAALLRAKFPASPGFTPPVLTDFTFSNQGSATATQTPWGISVSDSYASGSVNLRMLEQTAPATPYTMTLYIQNSSFMRTSVTYNHVGFYWKNSSASTAFTYDSINQTGFAAWVAAFQWSSFTTTAIVGGTLLTLPFGENWLQCSDDGTNRIVRFSADGLNFVQVYSVSRTTFLTPNRIGFSWAAFDPNYPVSATLLSWKQT